MCGDAVEHPFIAQDLAGNSKFPKFPEHTHGCEANCLRGSAPVQVLGRPIFRDSQRASFGLPGAESCSCCRRSCLPPTKNANHQPQFNVCFGASIFPAWQIDGHVLEAPEVLRLRPGFSVMWRMIAVGFLNRFVSIVLYCLVNAVPNHLAAWSSVSHNDLRKQVADKNIIWAFLGGNTEVMRVLGSALLAGLMPSNGLPCHVCMYTVSTPVVLCWMMDVGFVRGFCAVPMKK